MKRKQKQGLNKDRSTVTIPPGDDRKGRTPIKEKGIKRVTEIEEKIAKTGGRKGSQ